MSFQSFAQLLEAAAQNGGNVFIVADSVNLHLHVNGAPKSVAVDVLPKEKEALEPEGHPEIEEPLDDAMRRKLADVTADAKVIDEGPNATEKIVAAAVYAIKGDLTREKLFEFAEVKGFTKANAAKLWAMLGREEFREFFAERGLPLKQRKNGSYSMTSIRKAAGAEGLEAGCVYNYGPQMNDLFVAVAAE